MTLYISDEKRELKLATESGVYVSGNYNKEEVFSNYTENTLEIRYILIYCLVTFFVALFGAIYEVFSHMVYSYFMIYAFGIPLVLGVIPSLLFMVLRKRISGSGRISWNCGVAALTVGSIFYGVLEIYGTTNKLIVVYPIVGAMMLVAGIVLQFRGNKKEIKGQ